MLQLILCCSLEVLQAIVSGSNPTGGGTESERETTTSPSSSRSAISLIISTLATELGHGVRSMPAWPKSVDALSYVSTQALLFEEYVSHGQISPSVAHAVDERLRCFHAHRYITSSIQQPTLHIYVAAIDTLETTRHVLIFGHSIDHPLVVKCVQSLLYQVRAISVAEWQHLPYLRMWM